MAARRFSCPTRDNYGYYDIAFIVHTSREIRGACKGNMEPPGFMAPEVAANRGTYAALPTDVYYLGCVFAPVCPSSVWKCRVPATRTQRTLHRRIRQSGARLHAQEPKTSTGDGNGAAAFVEHVKGVIHTSCT